MKRHISEGICGPWECLPSLYRNVTVQHTSALTPWAHYNNYTSSFLSFLSVSGDSVLKTMSSCKVCECVSELSLGSTGKRKARVSG